MFGKYCKVRQVCMVLGLSLCILVSSMPFSFASSISEDNLIEEQLEYDQMIENELNLSISPRAIDQMLLRSQQWLNANYSNRTGFGSVPEDGTSRRSTVYGCVRALQIELGITATADNFGPGTISRFKTKYPNGISQQEYPSEIEDNVYGIIQCALWTKGYSTGANSITKHFYDGTASGIIDMKTDMGFQNPDSTITLNIMKSLLSMDYFVIVGAGTQQNRQIQQELNRTYPSYLGIIPCDGLYTRTMNTSLIIVLQAIEGYDEESATGNFGAGTKENLPLNLDMSSTWQEQMDTYHKCIKLIQYALCCNGYGKDINLSNIAWNQNLSNVISEFQQDMCIQSTGKMNVDTWMALLLSKGNPDRSCIACDTRFEMTQERINYLKANGYQTVGRYLTGTDFKVIREGELKRIIDNGLSFFPIFQESGTDITYFTSARAIQDASNAVNAARNFQIPENNIIYFAVDLDATDTQIASYIIPYFKSLSENIDSRYKIGIYGTRNVCTQIMNLGYSDTCFVSDMSTGYSGNMGFKMPNKWNLDQFAEIQVTTASGTWDLDKVAYSEKFPVVTSLTSQSQIKIIPANVTDYHFGDVEFYKENEGNWFTVKAKKMRYKIVWECLEGAGILQYLDVDLEKQGIGTVWDEDPHYNIYEYQTEWMNVSETSVYRFKYFCTDIGLGSELDKVFLNAKVSIYIDTID